ncbi:MAG: hypothetical protein ACOYM3_21545, partial [Terrimicrobiaceae bacterium]
MPDLFPTGMGARSCWSTAGAAMVGLGALLSLTMVVCGQTDGEVRNPYWPMANRSFALALDLPDDQLSKEAASNAFWLAWGATAPQSPANHKSRALEKCLLVWDAVAAASGKDDPKANGWNLLPLLESLRFLKSAHAVAPEKLAGWEAAMRPAVEDAFKEYGQASSQNW